MPNRPRVRVVSTDPYATSVNVVVTTEDGTVVPIPEVARATLVMQPGKLNTLLLRICDPEIDVQAVIGGHNDESPL